MVKRHHDPFDPLFDPIDEMGPGTTSHPGRLHAIRERLRHLFREEFEIKRIRIRPIRGKELIGIVSICAIVLFGFMVSKKFNKMVTMEETVLATNGRIVNSLQRRSNLFTTLINLTLNQAALEQEVFRHVANIRSAMMGRPKNKATQAEEISKKSFADTTSSGKPRMDPSMAKLLAVVERYPNIRASTTYQQLMDKLVEIEDRIIVRRGQYNDAVRDYNTYVTTFPQYILADIIGFKTYQYASANQIIPGDSFPLPTLAEPMFQRLLPLGAGQQGSTRPPHPINKVE
ncbi:MAG: LemA family protein [Magnetococcales bacterium]|nr:LemA family protein [Magnetococcales bacterium]